MKDSDGDGYTNGEELGDPCCVWHADDMPWAELMAHKATHPGRAAANLTGASFRSKEQCAGAPRSQLPFRSEYFLENEPQHHMDFVVQPQPIPSDMRTYYIDAGWNFDAPECEDNECYIVALEAIVASQFLHHYVLDACENAIPDLQQGHKIGRGLGGMGCKYSLGGWTPGREPFYQASPEASMLVADDLRSFKMNIHYDNPYLLEGFNDTSGFRVYYTTVPRAHQSATAGPLLISVDPSIKLEPNHQRRFLTMGCTFQGLTTPMHITSSWFHAHLLGTEYYAVLTKKDGTVIELGAQKKWYFDDQADYYLGWRNLTFENGDHLQSTCVYSTMGQESFVSLGPETQDEMCWVTFQYWPDQRWRCDGPVWQGELLPGEDGRQVEVLHPMSEADTILYDRGNINFRGVICHPENMARFEDADQTITELGQQCSGLALGSFTGPCLYLAGQIQACSCPENPGAGELTPAQHEIFHAVAQYVTQFLGLGEHDCERHGYWGAEAGGTKLTSECAALGKDCDQTEAQSAGEIAVGGERGWNAIPQPEATINVTVGDVLVFRYSTMHTVWQLPSANALARCNFAVEGSEELAGSTHGDSSSDGPQLAGAGNTLANVYRHRVTLGGQYYFACSEGFSRSHCAAGLAITVNVHERDGSFNGGNIMKGADPANLTYPSTADDDGGNSTTANMSYIAAAILGAGVVVLVAGLFLIKRRAAGSAGCKAPAACGADDEAP